jgi:hypothetical protein
MNRLALIAGVGFLGLATPAFSQRGPGQGMVPGRAMSSRAMTAPTSHPPLMLPGRRIGPSSAGPGRRVGPPTVRGARRVGPQTVNHGRRVGPPSAPLGRNRATLSTHGRRVGLPTMTIR